MIINGEHLSDMSFGDFNEHQVFEIEKSKLYTSLGDGIRSVEFIFFYRNYSKLCFVEAKKGFPKPSLEDDKASPKFRNEITELTEKFTHSFNLLLAVRNNIYEVPNDMPEAFIETQLNNLKIVFIVVIKRHARDWLDPIRNALNKTLILFKRIWKIDVILMNEEQAIKNRIAINEAALSTEV